MKSTIPKRGQFSVLRQICDLIPPHLVPKLARETGVDKKARTFSPWSHLVSLIYAQLVGSKLAMRIIHKCPAGQGSGSPSPKGKARALAPSQSYRFVNNPHGQL